VSGVFLLISFLIALLPAFTSPVARIAYLRAYEGIKYDQYMLILVDMQCRIFQRKKSL
jgi:hypothetical protein